MPRFSAIVLAALTLPACSDKVEIEGISGLPTDSIAFSFNARDVARNSAGGNTTATTIVLTDRENLCDEVASAGGLELMQDVFAVQLYAYSNSDGNNFDSNSSVSEVLFDPSTNQALLAARVIHREEGTTLFDGYSENLFDLEATTRGEFNINSVSSSPNGTNFGGNFKTQLDGDISNPEAYDIDYTGDEEPDIEGISATLEGRFTGAKDCDAFFSDVDLPDVDPDTGGEECEDEQLGNPNPNGGSVFVTEFGDVCAGGEDSMTYNVGTGCSTRLDVTVPDAFDSNGNQVRDIGVGLFFAGGGGTSPTGHTISEEEEFGDLRVYVEGGGDSLGAVTVRIAHQSGEGQVPYTLNTIVDCN